MTASDDPHVSPPDASHVDASADTDVSIIIPTYNRGARVRTCLQSVLDAGESRAEVIVVDDGSEDDTKEVVNAFEPAVRYVYQTNRGPSAARNAGVHHARGRYIAFLDSDDRLLRTPYRRVIAFLDRHPEVGVTFTDALVADASGKSSRAFRRAQLETFWALPYETVDGFKVFEPASFLRAMILDRNYVGMTISLIRRSALDKCGLFDERFIGYEEWDLFVRLAATVRFAYLDEPTAVIEKHESNLSGDLEKMVVSGVRVLEKFLDGGVDLPDDLRRATADKLNAMSFDAAYHAFVRGDAVAARQRFAAYMKRWGTSLPALAYWSSTWLPSRQVRRLREWKARLAR